MTLATPFSIETDMALVALKGARNGYIQLAPRNYTTRFADLPPGLFEAARDWATCLQDLGAERVFWLMLAEVVDHQHLHLYPRWSADPLRGLDLFQARMNEPQPAWTPAVEEALKAWTARHQVEVI